MPVDAYVKLKDPPSSTGSDRNAPPARVLIVDDCIEVARITALVLERAGHSLAIASNGEEALSYHGRQGPVGLLITDVVLPGRFSGYELAEKLKRRQPGLPVVFFTGYPTETISQERGYSNAYSHMFKPAMISEISRVVSDLLVQRD